MAIETAFGAPYQPARARSPTADPELAANVRRRQIVGRRIRQARDRLGITQARLALQIDTKRETVSTWENGGGSPNPMHLERIAEAVGEPVHYFYGGPTAHPQPVELDPDPYAQPPLDPAAAVATIGELLQVLDRVAVLLDRLGRAGGMVDARVETLRALGFGPPAPLESR